MADVQTCRGSHTHTLVLDPKDPDNVYIYISGSAGRPSLRRAGWLLRRRSSLQDPDTALFTIVIIKVPMAHPELAKIIDSPYILLPDPATGKEERSS